MITIDIRLRFATRHDEEADVYVGYCPSLDIYSQGTNQEQARRAVVNAAKLFITTCYDLDILHRVLRERGMNKATPVDAAELMERPDLEYITIGEFQNAFEETVPIHLLAAREAELACHQQ
jgi:hypothetical protein